MSKKPGVSFSKLLSFAGFGSLPSMGPKDIVCFDFVTEAVKAARLKMLPTKKLISDVYYKDVRGLAQQETVRIIGDFFTGSNKSKNYTAVIAIPSSLIITKNIEIPSKDPKEIKEIINLQAGRLTPYGREEVIIDYLQIGVFRQSYTKLLVVIIKKEIINKQLALFNEAGVKISKILLASEAMGNFVYNYLKLEIQDAPYCLIHTDFSCTDFGIFLKGKQIFSRSISIGAHQVLSEKDRYLSKFIEELKKSLNAYQAEDIEASPSLTVFTGAVEELKDLEIMILDAFRMPVKFLYTSDFIPKTDFVTKGAISPREISMLSVSSVPFCVDTQVINLIPQEIKLKLALEERGKEIIKTGILVMTMLLFICGIFLVNIYLKGEYLRKLNIKYKALNEDASQIEKDFSRVRIITNYLSGRGGSLNILSELYEITPLEIALTGINSKATGVLSVRGEATAMSSVFSYVSDLEKSPYFKNVKAKYTSKKKVEGQELVDFEIAIFLEGKEGEAK